MDRLLRPSLDRWVLGVLLALAVAGQLLWSSGEGPLAFVLNVVVGVAAGHALYGLALLMLVAARRARTRSRPAA